MNLAEATLARVLQRVDATWSPTQAAHHVVLGQTGSGKTTLIKHLMGLVERERLIVLDPKPHPDPAWEGPADDPWRWGKPVERLSPRFGFETREGGPHSMWARVTGSPDRIGTAKRFGEALGIIAAEGHACVIIDDATETCRQLKLAEQVDSCLDIARSSNVLVILSSTTLAWVAGKGQGGHVWLGKTSGLDAAKGGAALLGHSGREWRDIAAAVPPHGWIYSEDQPGNHGPVFVAP